MKRIAAIFGGLAVILGALGAHTLKDLLDANAMESFRTATMYQLFHAIALVAIPNDSKFTWTVRCWVSGTLLFSGSIYLLVFDELVGINLSVIGPITPLGGLFLIAGWISLWFAYPNKTSH
jgi:uncharacterized membrane protein YgdD (TMEM256/DUF423 family)